MRASRGVRLVLLTVVVAGSACGGGSDQDAAEGAPRRLTATVARGDLLIRAEATGAVEPVREVEVKSKASGEILRLHADVGDVVERGALLAEIDPRDVRNSYNQVQADLEVARARLEISEAQLERSTQLLAAEVITQQEHENARLDYTNARATLVRAETNFELAELQLMDVSIRAPMDGTIIQKNVEEGVVIQSASQNVSGGTPLFLMADLGDMQVRTLVDETDMGMLESGLPATVSVEAFPDRTFRGAIEKIEPQAVVEQNVTMFPVIVSLDNRMGLLKPGMNAEVVVSIDEARDVLLVPNNAVVQPQDVGPAALALGIDVEQLDLTPFMQAGRRAIFAGAGGGVPGRREGRDLGARSGERDRPSAPAPGAQLGGVAPPGQAGGGQSTEDAFVRIQELRAAVESGEVSQDSLRSAMQALRGQVGPGGFGGGFRAGADGGADVASGDRETRPAAVFVLGAQGDPEPRLVQLGIGDWDNTEIVSGVEEGEVLVIVGAAQLQAQQEAFIEQMRGRMGGSNPFGGPQVQFRGGGPGGFRGGGR